MTTLKIVLFAIGLIVSLYWILKGRKKNKNALSSSVNWLLPLAFLLLLIKSIRDLL